MRSDLADALSRNDAAVIAHSILDMPEPELMELVGELCYRRRFNAAVHALNELMEHPSDGFVARRAIQRLGLGGGW
jgi:hypothetical protein